MTVRIAAIGAGWWGQQHLRALSALRDVKLVGVVGRDPERTLKQAARFGTAGFTDIDEMLRVAKPDLVTVCLPNQSHFAPTLALLRAGVPLIVEKPLVFDLDEADQLLAAAGERYLFFAICFNHRYAKAMQMAKQHVDDGLLGDLVLATWRFGGEGPADHPWGNLIETQCHGFDTLEHLAGSIASVAATFSERSRPGTANTMAIALTFDSGAVGTLVGSYDDSYAHAGVHQLELVGTGGRLTVDDTVQRFSFSAHGSEVAEVWQPGYFNDRDRQFALTLDAYLAATIAAFVAGDPPPVPASAGRRALQLAHAAIESWQSGARVATAL